MKYKIILFGLVFLLAIGLVSAAPKNSNGNSGAIWTTNEDCGTEKQNVNHYSVGETVYINGANFMEGTYSWEIIGKPGKASTDPRITVAEDSVVVGSSGSFCFAAYTIEEEDSGEYGAHVGKKSDNYRVIGKVVEEKLSCEEAIQAELLTGYIEGNQAYVSNSASSTYKVSFVTYQMYSGNVFDQTPFDWTTTQIGPNEQEVLLYADVPDCSYQTDLVCGEPILEEAPEYGDRVIASTFGDQNNLCTLEKSSSDDGISAAIAVKDAFPQSNEDGLEYIFVCSAEGFSPSSYSWYYGDGHTLVNSTLDNVSHTYGSGEYTVACRATDGDNWAVGTLDIVVD